MLRNECCAEKLLAGWHFRHAVILRQGRVYGAGLQKLAAGKRHVVLLGDESASALAKDFGADSQVFDFGFKGDRIENVLWRVQQGELRGYDPDIVVLSVGRYNRGVNSAAEMTAAEKKLLSFVRKAAPKAEVRIVPAAE